MTTGIILATLALMPQPQKIVEKPGDPPPVRAAGVTTNAVDGISLNARFLEERVAVTDNAAYTCGSAPVACVSPDGKTFYAPVLASRTGFGECHDLALVTEIPLADPKAAKSYEICAKGDVFCGETVRAVLSFTSLLWKGKVRTTLDVNYGTCGWRDWDPVTKKVTGEGVYRARLGKGAPVEKLTPDTLQKYLAAKGMTGFNVYREAGDRLLSGMKPQWDGKAYYGCLTSSFSQPIVYRCEDGETFEFLGVVPEIAEYECQIAKLDGVIYALMRGAKGANFWASEDEGATFRPIGRLADGLQRPQMLVWKDKLLIGHSAPDEKPTIVRNGRNNLHVLRGKGTDLSQYREMMHAIDSFGIVYFDLVPTPDGALHVLWSNAERFPTHVKWGAVQGKDQVLYARLY